jgi:hypothetical protein
MKLRHAIILSVGLLLATFLGSASGVQFALKVARALPGAQADGTGIIARSSKYGETVTIPLTAGTYGLADEGSYFYASTATPGTAYNLTGATQTAFVATTPTFVVKNNDAEGAKRLFVDYVRVQITTGGTAGTRVEGAAVVDNISRYSSGGTALTVYSTNMDSATATISAQSFGGAITALAASGNVRYACRFALKLAIPAVGDSMMVNFGQLESVGTVASGEPRASCPPIVLGGGDTFLMYLWLPGQTATGTGEVTAAWWER